KSQYHVSIQNNLIYNSQDDRYRLVYVPEIPNIDKYIYAHAGTLKLSCPNCLKNFRYIYCIPLPDGKTIGAKSKNCNNKKDIYTSTESKADISITLNCTGSCYTS